MRAVVQRVLSASVIADGKEVSSIGQGLLVFVGIGEGDAAADAEYICRKILNMRLFPGEAKAWDLSVVQKNFEVLCVSQFTLFGFLQGNKPDFHYAMPPQLAQPFYDNFLQMVRKAYRPEAVKDGVFGAMMRVNIVNDGPVTFNLDSKQK